MHLKDVAPLPESRLTTSIAKLETNRAQVKRVLSVLVRATQYLRTNREGSIPTFMEFMKLGRADAEQAYVATIAGFSEDGTGSDYGMRLAIEAQRRQLDLAEEIPISRVADFGALHETLGELGITPAPDSAR